ncbi:MAG: hypothetical protein AB8F95_20445 [Bacteroidia bacterium]
MKSILFVLLALTSLQLHAQENKDDYCPLSFSVPQMSGIASASFKHYSVQRDSLFVHFQPQLDTSLQLLTSVPIPQHEMRKLDSLLSQTDSLGHHSLWSIIMGSPRFYIFTEYKGKKLEGFVANCYREHLFVFVDWLNRIVPEEGHLTYDKAELIEAEAEFYMDWKDLKAKRKAQRKSQRKAEKQLKGNGVYIKLL